MTSPAVADLENAISELKVIIASGLILSYFQVEPKILNLILKMHTWLEFDMQFCTYYNFHMKLWYQ